MSDCQCSGSVQLRNSTWELSQFGLPPVQSSSHWYHVDTTLFGIYRNVNTMLWLSPQNLWQVMQWCLPSLSLCLHYHGQPAHNIITLHATPNGMSVDGGDLLQPTDDRIMLAEVIMMVIL